MKKKDEFDEKELIRHLKVLGVDEYDRPIKPTVEEFERGGEEFGIRMKIMREIIENYDKGRLGSDGMETPIVPDKPKPPLNLGGYKKLEDEES
jgi:hypothetical protein